MDARRIMMRHAWPLSFLVALQGCGDGANQLPESNASRTTVVTDGSKPRAAHTGGQAGVTPMNDRVAVIGLLNKRNGLTRDLRMKPGDALRVGDAIVRLRACETAAPWEEMQEVGAFVQLDVRTPRKEEWRRVFSGWVFRERPDRNIVQHPIYDVWVKSCEMKWPESGPDTVAVGGNSGAKASSAADPGPADNSAASSASETSANAAASSD